jgi:uroporphyrinogen-III synthase
MQVQTFASQKAAISFAKNFKRHDRKRQPVVVALKGGKVVACSRKTARKLTAKRGNKVVAL